MKKIKSYKKHLKHQRRRQNRALRNAKRRQFNYIPNYARRKAEVNEEGFGYKTIAAPSDFSLVNNPDKMIAFLNVLKKHIFNGYSVTVDFSQISKITNDGLIALLSVAQDQRIPSAISVHVIEPTKPNLRKRLRESGIREESKGLDKLQPATHGQFRSKADVKADTAKANELIQFATRRIYGQRKKLRDVQRILSECVDNTTFHADPEKRLSEMWWGTVYYNEKKQTAYFSILDNGIGIIESLRIKILSSTRFNLKYRSNVKLLKAVFRGKVLSRTGEANRGKGLPKIYQARNRKEFERLIVISNDVYIDFDREIYKLLKTPFSGTFFYWEVKKHDER